MRRWPGYLRKLSGAVRSFFRGLVDGVMSRLDRQLTVAVIGALAVSCALYFLLEPPLSRAICAYYAANPAATDATTQAALESLQSYADQYTVSAADSDLLSRWMHRRPLTILHVYRDADLLYDSSLHTASGLHTHSALPYPSSGAHASVRSLSFADGPASVSLTVFPEYGVIQIASRILLLGCGLLFLALLLRCIRKKLRFFKRLEYELLSVAGGALDAPISVHGQDELARLAQCIEEMRRSLVQKLQQEEARQHQSYARIATLSHSLRTPLASLTGYLELLRRRNRVPELDGYVRKAMEHAVELKAVSDLVVEDGEGTRDEGVASGGSRG